jgi:DNA-binding PadR family transcriptional regulator
MAQQELIESYVNDYNRCMAQEKKPSHVSELMVVLSDGKWHSGLELSRRVSWRFGGYLHILKEHGVAWEKQRDTEKANVWYYRLTPDGR